MRNDVSQDHALVCLDRPVYFMRGQHVMLDADLAQLYEVETRSLLQACRRNRERFPADFLFQLNNQEFRSLRSQFVISSSHGGRRSTPYAFTELGIAMLSSVLRSARAVAVNIEIMRIFVRLRHSEAAYRHVMQEISALESKCDRSFQEVFAILRNVLGEASHAKRKIGFDP